MAGNEGRDWKSKLKYWESSVLSVLADKNTFRAVKNQCTHKRPQSGPNADDDLTLTASRYVPGRSCSLIWSTSHDLAPPARPGWTDAFRTTKRLHTRSWRLLLRRRRTTEITGNDCPEIEDRCSKSSVISYVSATSPFCCILKAVNVTDTFEKSEQFHATQMNSSTSIAEVERIPAVTEGEAANGGFAPRLRSFAAGIARMDAGNGWQCRQEQGRLRDRRNTLSRWSRGEGCSRLVRIKHRSSLTSRLLEPISANNTSVRSFVREAESVPLNGAATVEEAPHLLFRVIATLSRPSFRIATLHTKLSNPSFTKNISFQPPTSVLTKSSEVGLKSAMKAYKMSEDKTSKETNLKLEKADSLVQCVKNFAKRARRMVGDIRASIPVIRVTRGFRNLSSKLNGRQRWSLLPVRGCAPRKAPTGAQIPNKLVIKIDHAINVTVATITDK
ncbi:hypothetical protein WH47_03014 [Habropoda laboriosa]|uniref:Uncharacterized protein n=1 Tax=Habropoda laboriosa TaxID=597456 RepID=A0A0L7QSZ0_9HYME|nr:hypothetical protein WH47_03014 [Habropoda laboriosa]